MAHDKTQQITPGGEKHMSATFEGAMPIPPFGRRRARWAMANTYMANNDMAGPPPRPRGDRPRGGRRGGPGPWFGGPGGPGGPGGGPWMGRGGPGFGRGPRVGRGDVRAAILTLLAEEPMHGYQIIRELGERSGGVWKPSPGSVYPTLAQLEDEGLVSARQQEGKRVFELTDAGRAYHDSRDNQGPAPWEIATEDDDARHALHKLAMSVGAAVMQVAHVGADAQLAQASKILEETRRKLYRLLADEPSGDEPTS